jgi:hypothetical protein
VGKKRTRGAAAAPTSQAFFISRIAASHFFSCVAKSLASPSIVVHLHGAKKGWVQAGH